jgi:4-hydroxy-3-polyprenylbenzoate decarboxylase
MKIVIAGTGASGTIYLQRLLARLDARAHEIHLVLSEHAREVAAEELAGPLIVPEGITRHDDRSMHVPFTSGSARFDAMVIVPCSMGTIGRIAAGTSENNILRAADVFLKERRKLILVPRETPWSLVHARNVVAVIEAGALVLPAMPSFYHRPRSVEEAADTVVFRILDHLNLPVPGARRWQEEGQHPSREEHL